MRIGELSKRVGVKPQTLRYYESIGLLAEPPRSRSGYREYGEDAADLLLFIKSAQRLDMALDEIREILGFRSRGEQPCSYVLELLRRHVSELDDRIGEMIRLREELRELQEIADSLPEGPEKICRVIEHARLSGPTARR
jgi:DNA-binding transcriptional MerR regulator